MNILAPILAHAAAQGDKVALVTGNERLTYAELARRTSRIAANLARRGVKPGDVVAIRCDHIDFVCATLAIAWTGATSISFAGLRPNELEGMTRHAGVTFIVAESFSPKPWMPGFARLQDLLADGPPDIPLADCADDATWRIGYSSGTTGQRKVIRFSHAAGLAKSDLLSRIPKIRGERTLIHLGFALTFAIAYWMRELSRGVTVVLSAAAVDTVTAIEQSGADLIVSSPANAVELVRLLQKTGRRIPDSVKTVMLGGAPVSPAHRKLVREHLSSNLWINYGATEVGLVALLGPELLEIQPGSAGRVMPWVELEVVDDAGKPVPPLTEGVLRFRSPMMASGYILAADAPDGDRQAFGDGWFRSGDRGFVTEGRLLFLAARESDVMNLGGNKVDPVTVERALEDFPGVLECAAVAVPARSKGTMQVALFYVSDSPLDGEAMRLHCAARLEAWQAPRLFVRAAKLPRNESGKVMRPALIDELRRHTMKGKTKVQA